MQSNNDNYLNYLSTIGLQDPQVTLRTSNAVVDAIHDHSPNVEKEGRAILDYIADGYDNGRPLSLHIKGSVEALGFKIHPDSYLSITNTLIDRMGPDFYHMLQYSDDIQLYNFEGDKPRLELGCKERYMSIYEGMSSSSKGESDTSSQVPSDNDTSSNNAEESASQYSSDSDTSSKSAKESDSGYEYTPSDSEQEYINLPHNSSDSESMSSNSSSHSQPTFDSEDLNNISSILLYTVATFIVIQGIAWYVRKYHPDTLVKDSDIENHENVLYSINEDFYTFAFSDYIIKFILLLIPVSFLLMYKLRYYYFYRILMFFK